jgi:hypothetical protein
VTLQEIFWLAFGALLGVGIAMSLAALPGVLRWLFGVTRPMAAKWAAEDRMREPRKDAT